MNSAPCADRVLEVAQDAGAAHLIRLTVAPITGKLIFL